MTTQRDMVLASLYRPVYADRCAIPRRPMTPSEAAAAFRNAAVSAGYVPPAPQHFNVNRNVS